MTRLAFIHTVGSLPPTFEGLAAELDPGLETAHTVDETLLADAIAASAVPPATAERLEAHVRAALDAGADLVLVTCSSMGGATDELAERTGWPVTRVDEAMADRALELGSRIGVLATLRSTLEPTAALVRRRAGEREVLVVPRLAEGAFKALKAGDPERHDELVRAAFRSLLGTVDVIVLAQASMARVAESIAEEAAGTPILVSPRLGLERAVGRLRDG
jgi:Asp/Glu/hydantoin racemase